MERRFTIAFAVAAATLLAMPEAGGGACADNATELPCQLVQRHGLHFELEDGTPFRPMGSSLYWATPWLFYSEDTAATVRSALDGIAGIGANVVRIWAFNDGDSSAGIQPRPLEYNEMALRALDQTVYEIGKRGMRALLVFANYWSAYGGSEQYMQWAKAAGENVSEAQDFFTNEKMAFWYRSYVQMLLERNNTVTGRVYKDDPTIFANELINEPRYDGDPSGDVLHSWFDKHSWFVKQFDSKHLLTTGVEGFFGKSTSDIASRANPWKTSSGNDFVRNHRDLVHIDFAVHHVWVDHWLDSCDEECKRKFLLMWFVEHTAAATDLIGKPVLAEEYGKEGTDDRIWYFQRIHDLIEQGILHGNAAQGGDLVWQYGVREYSADDGFTVYPDEYMAITMMKAHSRFMRSV
jgi:mannan endo-1,4-beta-mannosidase